MLASITEPRPRSETMQCRTCGHPRWRKDGHAPWCIDGVFVLNVRPACLAGSGTHGVPARYSQGCRCGPCRLAWKLYMSDHALYPHGAQVVK